MELNPAQRRDAPIYDSYPPTSIRAPWTTARCNRLLRPLTSRVNILRKRRDKYHPDGEQRHGVSVSGPKSTAELGEKDDPSWIQSGRRTKHHKTYTHRRACPDIATSTGSKDLHKPLSIVMPGEVTVPTPVILRAKDITTESSHSGPYIEQLLAKLNKSHYSSASCYLSGLRKDTDPSTWQIYEGLSSGLDALLRATTTHDNYTGDSGSFQGRPGARSLFSMCLRRVPEYIKLEESWNNLESQAETRGAVAHLETDVASDVFSELESLGTSNRGGWNGLLEVVRSHGVSIICDALGNGVLCERVGEALVWICIENTAFDEAEAIVSAMISVFGEYPEPTKTDSLLFHRSVCVPLAALNTLATISSRRGYQFRELEALLRTGRLRKEWLTCRDFTKVWQEAIQALTERNPNYPGAMLFIATAIELTWGITGGSLDYDTHSLRFEGGGQLSGNPQQPIVDWRRLTADYTKGKNTAQQDLLITALDNTVYSVVTTLASIAILNQRFFEMEPESRTDMNEKISPALQLVHRLSTDILRASQLQHTWPYHAAGISRRILPALLAGLFVLSSFAEDSKIQKTNIARTLTKLIELSDGRGDSAKASSGIGASGAVLDLAYCINSITVCCAKATKDGGFPHISYFIQILRDLLDLPSTSNDLSYKDRRNLHQIAIESSYEFAEQNRAGGLLEWAQDVEQWPLGHNNLKAILTPGEGVRPRHGYQWERDLSHLAAGSPELARKHRIPQHIEGRRKQPKSESASERNRGYRNWSDFEDSEEGSRRSLKRRRKNRLPKTPRISSMVVGKHPPTSSPLVPENPPIQLSSPIDQLSGGLTAGFGNLPLRLRVNSQRRNNNIRRIPLDVRCANESDIDELGKSELTWDYVKSAITGCKPIRRHPTKRTVCQGHDNRVEKGRKSKGVKKYHWLQERAVSEDFSEDELLG
ncbi:hypothetical protein FGG08_004164 [Glutinoglossum americanum]|uniref:Uncharacterized protein n=1 Tax=Glutinoglossum americanum TaxID=1670608 RepID=A0A9P8L455_9PEZI|nr:hypothetical protein FGG08_004164 [Glutinoglossum americanum]